MNITPRTISTDWSRLPGGLTWYFIGQPKTGKTTASANWSSRGAEGVLLIDTDGGAEFVDGANVVTVTSLNAPSKATDGKNEEIIPPEERDYYYSTGSKMGKTMPVYSLFEVYAWLKRNWKELGYETLVIDTVDCVNDWIQIAVCEELGIDAMGQGQWGADWGKAKRKNVDIVKRLQDLVKRYGCNLILISHSKQTQMNDGKVQLSPELPRGLAYALCAKADVIGYSTVDKDSNVPTVSFQAYDERTVGSRLKPLTGKELEFSYKAITEEITNYKGEEDDVT